MAGVFISFEGTDGCGKSTQIRFLEEYLTRKGMKVHVTREPGGTPLSEEIRSMLLNPAYADMDPYAEALLYAASRAQHVQQGILPKLEDGYIVLSDRFVDSFLAYQGFGRGLGYDTMLDLTRYTAGEILPDRTFFLDIHPEGAFLRKDGAQTTDRMEMTKDGFYERVYDGFQHLAAAWPERIERIDASGSAEETRNRIRTSVDELLRVRGETAHA